MSTATLPLLAEDFTRRSRQAAPEGPWILTASGRPFALLHPEDSAIDIDDIAEALAKLCRWTGHTTKFYSVAQHSGIVHDILPLNARPYALLHDAHEAYIGDWSTPLKQAVRAAGGAETAQAIDAVTDRIDAAIHRAAGLALATAAGDRRRREAGRYDRAGDRAPRPCPRAAQNFRRRCRRPDPDPSSRSPGLARTTTSCCASMLCAGCSRT